MREVLSVMRLLDVIPAFDDEAKALLSFRQGHPAGYNPGSGISFVHYPHLKG